MSETTYHAVSSRIESDKALKRLGTASIRLDALEFPYSRGLDEKNVERLERLFHGQGGCLPGAVENRIPATISQATFQSALNISGITPEELLSDSVVHQRLELPSGSRLVCLRGRHRAQAAQHFNRASLNSDDYRWVIDLFDEGRFRNNICRQHAN